MINCATSSKHLVLDDLFEVDHLDEATIVNYLPASCMAPHDKRSATRASDCVVLHFYLFLLLE